MTIKRTLLTIVKHDNVSGQTIALVAISLTIILALAALAIDVGIAYNIKAKLNAAVDGAAIAAARAVKQGVNDSIRISNAQNAAVVFFAANYPTDYMGSTLLSGPSTSAVHNQDGSWTITVTARAVPPLFFARAVGWGTMNVRAAAETTVRELDMVLVLDCSGSMGPPTSPSTTFPRLKSAALNFVNRFTDGDGGDRVGLVPFASGAASTSSQGYVAINRDANRGFNKTQITNAINSLSVGGATSSAEAMRRAKAELDSVPTDYRSSLRVIVFFSDGAPNIVSGTFCNNGSSVCSGSSQRRGGLYSETSSGGAPYRMFSRVYRDTSLADADNIEFLPANDYDSTISGSGTVPLASYNGARTLTMSGGSIQNSRCNVNKAARNMVENVANEARSGSGNDAITVMTLGLGARLNSLEIDFCGYNLGSERGSTILRRLANTNDLDTDSDPLVSHNANQPTGLYCFAQTDENLDDCFQVIANQILRLTK